MEKHLLHEKVLSSDLEGVQSIISQKANLNELDDQGQSALHWAVMGGYFDIVKLLLEAGADPNILSSNGFTPKWSAEDWGLAEIANLLSKYGGKVATGNGFDKTSWTVFKNFLGQKLPKNE